MFFPEHGAIFFHVPRTGGVSVERMLAKGPLDAFVVDRPRLWGWDAEAQVYLQHATIATTLRLLGQRSLDDYYTFAVVREPFSRLVSVFHYNIRRYRGLYVTFTRYLQALPELLEMPRNKSGSHETPQHHFTHLDGEQAVDTLLRFEDLPGCMDTVRARLGITEALPHVNKNHHPGLWRVPPAAYYTAETIDLVRRAYAEDFALFGYPDTPSREVLGGGG